MRISAAPEKYQPAPPRYIRAGENSEDEENGQDEEEDLEAPYLAPKSTLSSGPAQNEESAQIPAAGDQTPAKDLSDSDLSESIPELIDLREEGEKPSPFPSQKVQHPTVLKLPILYSSPPEGQKGNDQEATIGVCQEKVWEEQIIYVVPPQSWGDRSDTKHSKCLLLGGRRLNQLTLIPKPKGSGGARAATAQVGPANNRNDTKRCLPVEASLRPGEAVPW